MKDIIKKRIEESIECKNKILKDDIMIDDILKAANEIYSRLKKDGKMMLAGNGGSASDCLHIAGEFLGRFQKERIAYRAVCLNADVATMTAVSNDYGYDYVFSRQINGIANKNDIFLGISTSGNSQNIINAAIEAKKKECFVVTLVGKTGGELRNLSDVCIVVPSNNTARIQESHIMIGHIICELVEEKMCADNE